MAEQQKTLTATERLANAENALIEAQHTMQGMYQVLLQATNDLLIAKEALKEIGKKVNAVAELAGLSNDAVNAQITKNSAAELKSKIDSLVAQGKLVASDQPTTESSFIVGREVNADGVETNPRLQFGVKYSKPEFKPKAIGLTVGSRVPLTEDGSVVLEVLEVYEIKEEAPAESVEAEAPQA